MFVTDLNKMSIEELLVINNGLGVSYVIENGGITGVVKNDEDRK